MKITHTVGPWRCERIGAAWRGSKEKGMAFRIEAPESSGAKSWDVAVVYNKPIWEEAEANARLLSAAPELLEALFLITKTYEKCDKAIAPTLKRAIIESRAAIAKAIGDQS